MARTNQKLSTSKINGKAIGKNGAKNNGHLESLLDLHRRHHGIFARVAQNLSVDPSYVSRVANGKRRSPAIEQALARELGRIASRS
jgi:transcriptional regulator with XRE-family HTH domain